MAITKTSFAKPGSRALSGGITIQSKNTRKQKPEEPEQEVSLAQRVDELDAALVRSDWWKNATEAEKYFADTLLSCMERGLNGYDYRSVEELTREAERWLDIS